MGRERRRRTRRSTALPGAGVPGMIPDDQAPAVSPRVVRTATPAAPVQVRSDRVLAREAATMISEMKRVAVVSGVCFGMLGVLVVVQRLQ